MYLKEIESILNENNEKNKIEFLSHLNDLFESYNKDIESFNEIVELLIKYAINEKDIKIKDRIFDTLSRAAAFLDIRKINLDLIEDHLDDLPCGCLISAISILGFSHNQRYVTSIKKYCSHENKDVRSEAETALVEIQGKA